MLDYIKPILQIAEILDESFLKDPLQGTNKKPIDFKIPIPGYGKEDVHIAVLNNTIKIEIKGQPNLTRRITLYRTVDPKNIKASVKNGMLYIKENLPNEPETSPGTSIEIE